MNTTDIWEKEFAERFAKVFDEFKELTTMRHSHS